MTTEKIINVIRDDDHADAIEVSEQGPLNCIRISTRRSLARFYALSATQSHKHR